MKKPFTRIDGWPVAVGILSAYLAMAAAFYARWGVALVVTSGIRTYTEQVAIFTARYSVRWFGNGPYGDVRWWRGLRYVRHSGAGTVAQPGTSNHETGRSLDLADTGADAGVASSFTNERNRWLSANCWRWGFTHTGKNFGEPWHFEQLQVTDPFLGRGKPNSISPDDPGEIIGGVAAGGGNEEDEMNAEQEAKLDKVLSILGIRVGPHNETVPESVGRLVKRTGGSVKQQTMTQTISEGRDAAVWGKARTRGSVKDPSLTAMLTAILEVVTGGDESAQRVIADRAAAIDLTLDTDPDPEYDETDEA